LIKHASLALAFLVGCVEPLDADVLVDTAGLPLDEAAAGGTVTDAGGLRGLGPTRVALGRRNDLAAPGAYALLASTAITNVTGSSIGRGHVGLSPSAASFITGFSLAMDPTNQFSTSTVVMGSNKVYAADYAPPTPTDLTDAVLAMGAAYTDAAGRTLPDYLDLNGGDLGGLTLAPGLYTWGSSVTVPTDVTIDGASNDIWIFQIANDLDVSAAQSVILSGGARARNIFWQVAGQATIHADAHFEGVILSQTAVTLQTNATMRGRILAQTLIALDDNMVIAP
jgi:hypothetical protein